MNAFEEFVNRAKPRNYPFTKERAHDLENLYDSKADPVFNKLFDKWQHSAKQIKPTTPESVERAATMSLEEEDCRKVLDHLKEKYPGLPGVYDQFGASVPHVWQDHLNTMQCIVFESGYNSEFAPFYTEPAIIVVQTADPEGGANREWAAYIGPASKGAEWVRGEGDKIPEQFAKYLFPDIRGRYRA